METDLSLSQNVVTQPGYMARVSEAIEAITAATSPAHAHSGLVRCVAALGVDHAFFASLDQDGGGGVACRLMLACDPQPFRRPLEDWTPAALPWLAYAALHGEPVDANDPWLRGAGPMPPSEDLWGREFKSAYLVPAHSGPEHTQCGLLVLGSVHPGRFADPGLPRLRQAARALAAELRDWWAARDRQALFSRVHLNPFELDLLRHARRGHCSKQIARALATTVGAVDSRFQRLNSRLGVPNRKAAARLAVACRLLPF